MGVFKSKQIVTAAPVIGKLFSLMYQNILISQRATQLNHFSTFKLSSIDFHFLYVF